MEIKKYHFEDLITKEVTDWERIVKRIKASKSQSAKESKPQSSKAAKHDIEAKDMKF